MKQITGAHSIFSESIFSIVVVAHFAHKRALSSVEFSEYRLDNKTKNCYTVMCLRVFWGRAFFNYSPTRSRVEIKSLILNKNTFACWLRFCMREKWDARG